MNTRANAVFTLTKGPLSWWVAPLAYGLGLAMLVVVSLFGGTPVIAQLLGFVLLAAIATAVALGFGPGRARQTLGLTLPRHSGGRVVSITLGGIACLWLISALGERISPETANSTQTVLRAMGAGQNPATDLALVLGICVLAPLGEEALYRGMIFRGLFDGLQNAPAWLGALTRPIPALIVALAVSSLIFASAHGGEGQELPVVMILVIHGVIYGGLYALTGTLWAPVVAHSANNSLALVAVFFGAQPHGMAQISQYAVLIAPLLTLGLLWLWARCLPRTAM